MRLGKLSSAGFIEDVFGPRDGNIAVRTTEAGIVLLAFRHLIEAGFPIVIGLERRGAADVAQLLFKELGFDVVETHLAPTDETKH